MSISGFQRAIADLIASPSMCLAVRQDSGRHLAAYELTERERRRLATVVWQRGMSTSCTLYRINRVTPLYSLLPLTCQLLGDRFIEQVTIFWQEAGDGHPEFLPEARRFADFLSRRAASAELSEPYLDEVLRFELALNALHFLPRRDPRFAVATGSRPAGHGLRINPLIRLVKFDHEPLPILEALAERQPLPPPSDAGDFFVALDGRGDGFSLRLVDSAVGYALSLVEDRGVVLDGDLENLPVLLAEGLVVPA
jgi:hypothetical protein